MSADHLELLVVFGKKENCVKVLKDFQMYHLGLSWEVNLLVISVSVVGNLRKRLKSFRLRYFNFQSSDNIEQCPNLISDHTMVVTGNLNLLYEI